MNETGASAAKTIEILMMLDFTHVLMIPDSESRQFFTAVEAADSLKLITPCREGESVTIAAGLWTGGKKPLLVIQNTGFMEAGDALRGCGLGPKVPLRLMIGWRGYGGALAGKRPIDSAYTYTMPLLDAWGIPHWELMSDADLGVIETMDRKAAETSMPAAVVTGYAFRV